MLQVSLLEDRYMMRDVPGDHVCEGAHGESIAAGGACSHPGILRQVAEECDCGLPNCAKLVEMA